MVLELFTTSRSPGCEVPGQVDEAGHSGGGAGRRCGDQKPDLVPRQTPGLGQHPCVEGLGKVEGEGRGPHGRTSLWGWYRQGLRPSFPALPPQPSAVRAFSRPRGPTPSR